MDVLALSENNIPVAFVKLSPIAKKDRIIFLDCVRGLAVLGILMMNIMSQGQSQRFYTTLNLDQPITGANYWVWLIERLFFEGTMRGLFSILFGASTLLLLERLVKHHPGLQPADIFYRRMLWLLLFGLVNAFIFLWPGDILYDYALCGLLLFPFRSWSGRNLFLASLFFLAVATYRENSILYDQKKIMTEGVAAAQLTGRQVTLTDKQQEALRAWNSFKEKSSSKGMMRQAKEETARVQGQSYSAIFRYYRDINMARESTTFYNMHIWDILLFLFAGMALFKSRFLHGEKPLALYIVVTVIGIGSGLLLNYLDTRTAYTYRFNAVQIVQHEYFSYYQIRRLVHTLGYLSLLVLLYKTSFGRKLMLGFAPVGRMAFTNYLMQSIITSIIFYGFALYGKLQRYEIYYVMLCIWIFQILFSYAWLHYFRFGPFEWLWRGGTYGHMPAMRYSRSAAEDTTALPGAG